MTLTLTRLGHWIRRAIQLFAPARLKRWQWDREYRSGKWAHCTNTEWPLLYKLICQYCNGGSILDMGCGPGLTATELPECYRYYLGVDISQTCIDEAFALAKKRGACSCTSFTAHDIETFTTPQKFDVILFRESIYYLRDPVAVLKRLRNNLTEQGVFVIVCSENGSQHYVSLMFDIGDKVKPIRFDCGENWEILVCK